MRMLVKTVWALTFSFLLLSCGGAYKINARIVGSPPDLRANDINLEVIINAAGYSNTEMANLIRDGISQSGVMCTDLEGILSRADCKLVWTINRSDPVRPFVSILANLYVNGSLSQTFMDTVPGPNTQPRSAFVREISDMMNTLKARVRRQTRV